MFHMFVLLLIFGLLLELTSGQTYNVGTYAGSGVSGWLDSKGTVAQFATPRGVAVDSAGIVYVADHANSRIRKILWDGTVSTIAGSGTAGFLDGYRTTASFQTPVDLDVDPSGNVVIADSWNNMIRTMTPDGQVSWYAGTGASTPITNGARSSATFNYPHRLSVDKSSNVIVSDTYNNIVRQISLAGSVTTLAGNALAVLTNGPVGSASFNGPCGVVTDSSGRVFVCDFNNNVVRRIFGGQVTTFAGSSSPAWGDGTGGSSTFNGPHGLSIDPSDNLYVADVYNHCIRKITPAAVVTTIAGKGSSGYTDAAGLSAAFNNPQDVVFDSGRNSLFVADAINQRIRKIAVCITGTVYDSITKNCTCSSPLVLSPTEGKCTCPLGTEILSDGVTCSTCKFGQYRSSLLTTTVCSLCPLGTEPSTDKSACNNCTSDKYRPSNDYAICISCPLNAICNSTNLVSCAAGYKINSAGDSCESCPLGTQSSADSKSCVSCNSGSTFRSLLTQTTCQSCPGNSDCTTTGFTCNAEYEPALDGLDCSQCLEGYSKASAGNVACIQCVIGTESSADKQSCSNCATGYYRSNLSVSKCIPCPTGATCSTTAITRCPNGYKKNSNNDGCEQCSIGQDSSDGLNCQGCAPNYFKPDQSYQMCVKCPEGAPSCGGNLVTCQTGYFYDYNAQCKRNETYFLLIQTATNTASTITSYVTQTTSLYNTATVPTTVFATIVSAASAAGNVQTVSVTNTITVTQQNEVTVTQQNQAFVTASTGVTDGKSQPQVQSANSVTVDFIGLTLPISPVTFAAAAFGAGLFVMFIFSLVCCRKSRKSRKDEEFDGVTGMTTTALNTTSQRTFTNSSTVR